MTPNSNQSILIIDDDLVFSQLMVRAFAKRGYSAHSAIDGNSALQKSRDILPDLIVLDLKLGNESGLQLIQPLLQICDARILVLTGYASISTAVDAIKRGAFNYLQKPADVKSVLAALTDRSDQVAAIEQTPLSVERMEWEHIHKTLEDFAGNVSATARALNMHRRTLQRKLAKKPVKK